MAKLRGKRHAFVLEYLKDNDATEAYKRAGYKGTGHTAEVNASRLLKNAEIRAEIDRIQASAQAKAEKRVEVSIAYVLGMLKKNLERAMQEEPVLDKDGNPTGEFRYDGAVANKAAELIGKHLGMFPSKVDHTGSVELHTVGIKVVIPERKQVESVPPAIQSRMNGSYNGNGHANGHHANGNGSSAMGDGAG